MAKKILFAAIGAAAAGIGFAGNAEAATVSFDATGPNTFNTPSFYGVEFLEGPNKFISSISYDLSGFPTNTFFDFNDPVSGSFQGAAVPIFDSLVGLAAADISFNFLNPVGGDPLHPSVLEFTFAPGSFGVGDSFRFAADTDGILASSASFGQEGVPVSVVLEGGKTGSAMFAQTGPLQSVAVVEIPHEDVPEPTSLIGLLCAGAAATGIALKKKAA